MQALSLLTLIGPKITGLMIRAQQGAFWAASCTGVLKQVEGLRSDAAAVK